VVCSAFADFVGAIVEEVFEVALGLTLLLPIAKS